MPQQTAQTEQQPSPAAELEQLPLDDIFNQLSTDPDHGLSAEEANRRLEQHGRNTIEEKQESVFLRFASYFWGPIPWMIEIAVILSLIAGRWEDFGVILAMLLINGGVGFWHENKAANAIEALKQQLALKARVLRDGKRQTIDAEELVPGDIILLKIGNMTPADARLLAGQHLSMDESALTGESLPVDKDEGQTVYSGTPVKRGEAKAVVTGTGRDTKFAQTVEMVAQAGEVSHFQKAALRIGYFLIGITLFLDVLILSVSIVVRSQPWLDVALLVMALTLAGIPAALPAVLSITMSIGAHRLARMKAIVSRLAAMEEMAGLEVLCADKTGTLTLNQLTLQNPVLLQAQDEHDLLLSAALTCDREETDDPIDQAVLGGFQQRFNDSELDEYQITNFKPFDPTRKRAEADIEHNNEQFQVAKGAPQVILDLVNPNEHDRQEINGRVDQLGEQGFRALGVARKSGNGWEYLGLLPLLDPPREDSAEVIQQAKDHGIDVRMVTGDHEAIGRQVAEQVGLAPEGREPRIVRATELFGTKEEAATGAQKKGTAQIRHEVLSAEGFAEVTPEHKYRLVKAFQENDRIVGMTGDGVNDAPALQQADVGIAVAGATDAARSASDLVLTEKGLRVIIYAVEEARRIFERMISYTTFRITETIRVLIFIGLAILVLGYSPVTAIMIVLLAILNDIPIIAIAWDNARTAKHPVRWDMPRVLTVASVLGVAGVIESFTLFCYFLFFRNLPREVVQSAMFLKLLVAGHMTLYLARSRGWMWQKPWPNLWMVAALESTQVVGTLAAVYGVLIAPIGWAIAGIVWGYAILWILLLDAVKVLTYRILDHLRGHQPPKRRPEGHLEPALTKRLEAIEHTVEANREMLEETQKCLKELASRNKS